MYVKANNKNDDKFRQRNRNCRKELYTHIHTRPHTQAHTQLIREHQHAYHFHKLENSQTGEEGINNETNKSTYHDNR